MASAIVRRGGSVCKILGAAANPLNQALLFETGEIAPNRSLGGTRDRDRIRDTHKAIRSKNPKNHFLTLTLNHGYPPNTLSTGEAFPADITSIIGSFSIMHNVK